MDKLRLEIRAMDEVQDWGKNEGQEEKKDGILALFLCL